MKYPTMAAVNIAGKLELAHWYRNLPSPGTAYIGKLSMDQFKEKMADEKAILDRIITRFDSEGGMTPEISKAIG